MRKLQPARKSCIHTEWLFIVNNFPCFFIYRQIIWETFFCRFPGRCLFPMFRRHMLCRWVSINFFSSQYLQVIRGLQPPPSPPPRFHICRIRSLWSNFKEIFRKKLSLTWGWPEVVSMSPYCFIELGGPDLSSSLYPYYVYLYIVKANEWEIAFF